MNLNSFGPNVLLQLSQHAATPTDMPREDTGSKKRRTSSA